MKLITWLVVLTLASSPCIAAKDKPKSFWQKLFTPPITPTPKPKKRHRAAQKKQVSPTPTPVRDATPRNGDGCFIVDTQWYANYVTEEMAWDYWIPEDAEVKFKDGKYHVPPVVYRHYQDMVSTPRAGRVPDKQ